MMKENNHQNYSQKKKKYRKLAQKKCKKIFDWVGKVIHEELCKILKFAHTKKCDMLKPLSVLENETRKILRDFVIVWK